MMQLSAQEIEAYLGRAPAPFDAQALRAFFRSKRVLVTGAGGSIGSELCRLLAQLGCERLSLLDNSDHNLIHAMTLVAEANPRQAATDILCDVRDMTRLARCFETERPNIVVHAAALKHVHLGERFPNECVLTNLIGARNVVDALSGVGGGRFLLVSTDKAANPVSVMGAAKRLAEMYVRGVDASGGPVRAMAVRFGNVFGTRGSVGPLFAKQIAQRRAVKVTHPEMERYFMSVSEAVQLILTALAAPIDCVSQCPSPVMLLEMGDPVRIVALAERMIAHAGLRPHRDIPIEFSGLRAGEKLREDLIDEREAIQPSGMAGIYRVQALAPNAMIDATALRELEHVARHQSEIMVRQRVFAWLRDSLGWQEEAAG